MVGDDSRVAEDERRKIVNLFMIKYPLEMCRTSPHLVEQRPWPLFMGMVGLRMVVNLVIMFRGQGSLRLGFIRFLRFVLVSAQ